MTTKNLGQVKALQISSSPPTNTSMLWYDTGTNIVKYYNLSTSAWTPLAGQAGGVLYVPATGTNTYVSTATLSAYSQNQLYILSVANANTGASTLNVNSLGELAIKKLFGSSLTDLSSGDLISTGRYLLSYDGTQFILMGSAGGEFDIYGYNTIVPTTVTVGGVPVGTTFSPTELVKDVVYQILNPFIPPSGMSINITGGSLFEKGTTVDSFTINFTITPNNGIVTVRDILQNTTVLNSPIVNSGSYSPSGLGLTFATSTANLTFYYQVQFSNYSTQSVNVVVTFIAPSFYGVGASSLLSGVTNVAGLNTALPSSKYLPTSKALSNVNFNGTTVRTFYVYPAVLGNLTSILDQNGFQTLPGWTRSTKSILLADGVTSETYNVYMSSNDASFSNFKYSFS